MLAIRLHVRGVGTKAKIEGGKTQQGIGYVVEEGVAG
jgi:hypothetical protein